MGRDSRERRWELTPEERERITALYTRPLRPRDLVGLVAGNPRLALEAAESMLQGAGDAIRQGSSITWAIDAERVRQAIPDAASGVSWSGEQTFLEPLLRHAEAARTALDLGCGGGRFARQVAPLVDELVCVDPSRLLLREARIALERFTNVRFVRNHGATLPGVRSESVDLVFSQGLFSYVDPRMIFALSREAARVLRPGGTLLVSVFTFDEGSSAAQVRASLQQQIDRGRLHSGVPQPYHVAYVEHLLGLAGLEPGARDDTPLARETGYRVFAARRPA